MLNIIGLKEFRENTKKYINRVSRGDSFVVVKRSKPVFKISSPDEDEEVWETVVDFTDGGKSPGMPAEEFLERLRNG